MCSRHRRSTTITGSSRRRVFAHKSGRNAFRRLCKPGVAWQDNPAQNQHELANRMRTVSTHPSSQTAAPVDRSPLTDPQIPSVVEEVLAGTQFIDIHTHLYP